MIFSIDSNVLLYAIDADSPQKRAIAHEVVAGGWAVDAVISSQALGEFIAVVRRKQPTQLGVAIRLVEHWSLLFQIGWTGPDHLVSAAKLSHKHRLQFWDSVILEVSRERGAGVLLTEDMQDGATIGGVLIVNPFRTENRLRLDELLRR